MLLRGLLLASLLIHGWALPTRSSCAFECLKEEGALLAEASNLRSFQNVAKGIDDFCETNAKVIACGDGCVAEEKSEVHEKAAFSSFVCHDKIEEFRLIRECLAEDGSDSLQKCADDCSLPQTTSLRFDSSSASVINPTALLDSLDGVCAQHLCVLNCAVHDLNRRCAGSGELLKDLGRRQVTDGSERLAAQSANTSNPLAQQLAQRFLQELPGGCSFVKDSHVFDQVTKETGKEEETGSEFAADYSDTHDTGFSTDSDASGDGSTLAPEFTGDEPQVPIGPPDDKDGQSGQEEPLASADDNAATSGESGETMSGAELETNEDSGEESGEAATTETVLTVDDEQERMIETNRIDAGHADSFKAKSSSRFIIALASLLLPFAIFFL